MSTAASILQIFDLALGFIGFLAAYVLYRIGTSDPVSFSTLSPGLIISILTFWFCTERQNADSADAWVAFIEQVSLSMGLNLIIQALLTYFQVYQHIPLVLIFAGGLLSSTLLAVVTKWMEAYLPVSREGVLLVGFDPESYPLVRSLGQPIVGVLEWGAPVAAIPAELPVLGTIERLAEIVLEKHPSRIVVARENWESDVGAKTLLSFRLSGIAVNNIPSLQEKLRYRISAGGFEPSDFVLSPALTPNRRAMAIQSVYTNLIGLLLLLVSLPLMLLIALAVALFSGRGPVFEGVECLGFQKIPFQRFRFRTSRGGRRAKASAVGRLIALLGLENLPQLINVVRGEMALVGPQAARTMFAERLIELMPFYSHRFTVKPGIFGWAQLHMQRQPVFNESSRIEYDLYYVKEGSPALDLEILVRYLFGRRTKDAPDR
jgi:lipopolysaccharide/colanic/teichoic acid biosynthesis glycosyltransferase